MTVPPALRAASMTSGGEPWALNMTGAPGGTTATSSMKTTPRDLK